MRKFFWCLVSVFSTLFPCMVSAQTIVPQSLDHNETWTISGSPYQIEHDFIVEKGATLNLEPGVRVEIGDVDTNSFMVQGTLRVLGTKELPVIFSSLSSSTYNWSLSTQGGVLEIHNAFFYDSDGGLNIQDGSLAIENSSFFNTGSCISGERSVISVKGVVCEGARYGGMSFFDHSRAYVENSHIASTTDGQAIYVGGVSTLFLSTTTIFQSAYQSAIQGNRALIFATSTTLIGSVSGTQEGIALKDSFLVLASSSISQFKTGLYILDSDVLVSSSTIASNEVGVLVKKPSGVILGIRDNKTFNDYVGGEGNALVENEVSTRVKMYGSRVFSNSNFGVYNDRDDQFIDATYVWWGNESGPKNASINPLGGGDSVYGLVVIDPWLKEDPSLKKSTLLCCSNIAFIPGFQATRLFMQKKGRVYDSVNQLWEPNRNGDVAKMFLDKNGTPLNSGIYTGSVIDSVFGKKIYAPILDLLSALTLRGKIKEWKSLPYDWRLGQEDVVRENVRTATSSYRMEEEIIALASSSPTKKVSIISHSNGGLIAKELFLELRKKGLSDRIDQIILVAVPQFGTPKAVASLLHGYDQELAKGIVLSASTARTFGVHMPGAYGLLPSLQYFSHAKNPVIRFASSTLAGWNVGKYFDSIADSSELFSFLGGEGNSRVGPKDNDLVHPAILEKELLAQSDTMHRAIDTLSFGTSTQVVTIVGHGLLTPESIVYSAKKKCTDRIAIHCKAKDTLEFSLLSGRHGDGTVVVQSAQGIKNNFVPDSTIYVDLDKYNTESKTSVDHGTIFSAAPVLSTIENVITQIPVQSSVYISTTSPLWNDNDLVRVSVHSPVELHVYDEEGHHTGPVNNPTETDDLIFFDEEIPNSQYEVYGDDEKSVTLSPGRKYTVKLKGTDTGIFSIDTEYISGFEVIQKNEFPELPVTAFLEGSMEIQPASFASSTQQGSSSVPGVHAVLSLDVDGNGTVDIVPNLRSEDSLKDFTEVIRAMILSLQISDKRKKNLITRLDAINEKIKKGNYDEFVSWIERLFLKKQTPGKRHLKMKRNDHEKVSEIMEELLRGNY